MAEIEKSKGILLESGTNEVEFLEFGVGDQHFGINVGKVRQIMTLETNGLTQLPGSIPGLAGITYFRGKPIPVISLREYLNKSSCEAPARPLLIVAELNQAVAGFIIDAVHGITRVNWDQFTPIAGGVLDDSDVNVVGSVKVNDVVVLILDVETLVGEFLPTARIDSFVSKVEKRVDANRAKIRIMYCEDSSVVQKVLLKTLRDAGFAEFKVFSTGEDGFNYLKTHTESCVDIVISDIEMPKMDGLTLCRALRTLPLYKNVPVVFFSSMITDEMRTKCKSVGGTDAFSKPEIHKIVDAIDAIITIKH